MQDVIGRAWRAAAARSASVAVLCILWFCGALGAAAQERAAPIEALARALRVAESVEIMRDEGLVYSDQIAATMLPDVDHAAWRAQVAQLYDPARMQELVLQGLERSLKGADLAPMLAFFESEAGRMAVRAELDARRAFLDPAEEEAARAAAQAGEAATDGPQARLLGQIRQLIDSGDLIERNVAAALNGDMMFWSGVMDAGAPGPAADGEELSDVVTADLEQTRRDTEEWIMAFLMAACAPLSPEQMDAYVVFFGTQAGRDLNAALFDGYNGMYDQMAYILGHMAGSWMVSAPL
ncbi:hypothetical protein DC366_17205 [Pelagivirga sediminicola]|uniref:DUF2059 domain-containing protein n=1 Tax=Pelagivirga sediminicola TaxID=2170575 RepID=A0A2T7G354_9RHOB|nr:DUF2059 domain-containing protein [Pelagivirga sediminicola]PVA08836.1 hypothetical protein DC366_17205 [Pelagivirga sediminicola]